MLGVESSQAERRNVANANSNSKRMPVMLELFLMGRDLDRVRVKSPNITGILFFEFNLHHLDEPDGKHPYLEGDRDTRALCQRLHSIRLDEDHIDKPMTSCKRTSLFPMLITLLRTTLASCS